MNYNLLEERWIPVRRVSGRSDWIAPWQIAETDDPPAMVVSVRPDFDGALLQFLIGLVQTACAPVDESAWRRRLRPPAPEELRSEFALYREAFELVGDGPLFLQEAGLLSEDPTMLGVDRLLLEVPGEQTLEQNADVFVKRGGGCRFGLPSVAAALLTLQMNAPSGGRGFRTSLRGGGPLNTVLVLDTLWATVWINILPKDEFLARGGNGDLHDLPAKYPWMGPPRTSEKGEEIGPTRIHPSQQFWSMPRRVLLSVDEQEGVCDLTGLRGPVVRGMAVKSYGTNYKGAFEHPLTPYTEGAPGTAPNPKKLSTDGLPYRDWPLYTVGRDKVRPARVVAHALVNRRPDEARKATGSTARLLAFGFSMDNAKAEAWFSGLAPVLDLPKDSAAFRRRVGQAVAVADEVRRTLGSCVLEATKRRPDDVKDKYGNALAENLSRSFWSRTETPFFELVRDLHALLDHDEADSVVEDRIRSWVGTLQSTARALFEDFSQEKGDFAAADVKRVGMAWNRLLAFTSLHNPKVLEAAGLPIDEDEVPARKGRKTK